MNNESNTPNFDRWLWLNDPDLEPIHREATQIVTEYRRIMDSPVTRPDLTISPLECVMLAEHSDQIERRKPFSETTAYRQLQRQKEAYEAERRVNRPAAREFVPWSERPIPIGWALLVYAGLVAGAWYGCKFVIALAQGVH